jgi:hypothetical protein
VEQGTNEIMFTKYHKTIIKLLNNCWNRVLMKKCSQNTTKIPLNYLIIVCQCSLRSGRFFDKCTPTSSQL